MRRRLCSGLLVLSATHAVAAAAESPVAPDLSVGRKNIPEVVVEVFYSGEFGGLDAARRAVTPAEAALVVPSGIVMPRESGADGQGQTRKQEARSPTCRVSVLFHDYDTTDEYIQLRAWERASGLADYSALEAFVHLAGSTGTLALSGADAIAAGLVDACRGVLAAGREAGAETRQSLLALASRALPAARTLEALEPPGLYRIGTQPTSPADGGYLYVYDGRDDCRTCPGIHFAVILDARGAVMAVAPIMPIIVKGRAYDAAAFLEAFKGADDPEALMLAGDADDGQAGAGPAHAKAVRRIPAIPGGREVSAAYLGGVRRAIFAVRGVLAAEVKQ